MAGIGFASVVSMLPGIFIFPAASELVAVARDGSASTPALIAGAAGNGMTAVLVVLGMTLGLLGPKSISVGLLRRQVRDRSLVPRFRRSHAWLNGTRRSGTARERLRAGRRFAEGKMVAPGDATKLLVAIIRPGDRVCLEGDNQKQADFLARALTKVDKGKVHDLHIVQSGIVLSEHLDLFEKGIATKLDYSYSGPQSEAVARALNGGKIKLGAIHTYIELFARYFVDLTPKVAMTVARQADHDGNLYMGPNVEDSPVVVEATAFKQGIVVAQVNEVVDKLPRIDVPGDRIDFVVETPQPFYVEPLFTRDPAQITETQILMAMMTIKGIYEPYGIKRLNHGIGFNTAAIELLLPTYGETLGLKGKVCTHFALNPHPTLIPAIESGWVKQIHSFGSEVGMDAYMTARPDVYFLGRDGSMASNRMYCQVAGPLRDRPVHRRDPADGPRPATARPSRRIASPVSAAPPTWARTRTAAATRATPGSRPAAKRRDKHPALSRGRKLVVADDRDLWQRHGAVLRRESRQPEARREAEDGARAGDDLWRRRHPRRDGRGHRQPTALAGTRTSANRAIRGVAGLHRGPGEVATPRRSTNCAAARSSCAPRISA